MTNALVSVFTVKLSGCNMWAEVETHLRQCAGFDALSPPTKMPSPKAEVTSVVMALLVHSRFRFFFKIEVLFNFKFNMQPKNF